MDGWQAALLAASRLTLAARLMSTPRVRTPMPTLTRRGASPSNIARLPELLGKADRDSRQPENEPGLMRALRRVSNGLTNSAHSNHVPGHSTQRRGGRA
jgi:hypothetical protein